jgi:hypothetical protein
MTEHNSRSLPKWIEEKRMGHSIVRNSEWDKLMVAALTIAVEALENASTRGDGIKPGFVDYENCFRNAKWEAKEALRRIEELGK